MGSRYCVECGSSVRMLSQQNAHADNTAVRQGYKKLGLIEAFNEIIH